MAIAILPQSTWYSGGAVAAAGSLFVYQTGTTSLVTVYSDFGLTTPIPNPITLDSNGQAKFYVGSSVSLRLDAYTSAGALIESLDPVFVISTSATNGYLTQVVISTGSGVSVQSSDAGTLFYAPSGSGGYTYSIDNLSSFVGYFGFANPNNSGTVKINTVGLINGWGILDETTSITLPSHATNGTPMVILFSDGTGDFDVVYVTPDVQGIASIAVNNYITGYLPTSITASSSASASLTVTSGAAANSTNATMIRGGSFPWNITTGNAANGYQGGTTLPNSSTIHFYVIVKSDFSTPASFASTSLTPTLPTGYTSGFYRRVFSLFTNSSGVLLGQVGSGGNAIEIAGGAMLFWFTAQPLDVNTSTLTTSRTAFTLSLPSGIKVQPLFRATSSGTGPQIILTGGDETDVALSAYSSGSAPLNDMESNSNNGRPQMGKSYLTTNASAQIGARSSAASTSLWLVTAGFIDPRRS